MRRLLAIALAVLAVLLATAASRAEAQAPTEAALVGISQLSAGGRHTCARLSNGQARCWGSNSDGEAGNGTLQVNAMPVTTVLAVTGNGPLTGVTQIEAGFYHACALLTSGQVRCWGYNGDGQVGNGSAAEKIARAKIVSNPSGTGPLTGVIQISAGQGHSCALLETRQLRCWGANGAGQIGDGTSGNQYHRPRVVRNVADTGPLRGVTQVEAGGFTTCARMSSGQARCWGEGDEGQLGNAGGGDSSLPVVVETMGGTPQQGVTQIAVDEVHTCARLSSGQAVCWGANGEGQLGDGTLDPHIYPAPVANVGGTGPLLGVTRIDVGRFSTCAALANQQARCWGRGDDGQLGNDFSLDSKLPQVVVNPAANGSLMNVRRVRVGASHACAVLTNGQARCWGLNANAQVGDRSTDNRDHPRPVILGPVIT